MLFYSLEANTKAQLVHLVATIVLEECHWTVLAVERELRVGLHYDDSVNSNGTLTYGLGVYAVVFLFVLVSTCCIGAGVEVHDTSDC